MSRRSMPCAMVGLLVAALLAVPGRAIAEGDPPVVSNGSVTPANLPYTGGTVTVSADVTSEDNTPMNEVSVVVSAGTYTAQESALSPDSGGTTYSGSVDIGANGAQEPFTWHLTVHARDIDNQEATGDAGDVIVAAAPPDDAVPAVSGLSVKPRSVSADGGGVRVAVTATDVRGIDSVGADVVRAGLTRHVVLVAISDGGDRFAATIHLERNATTTVRSYALSVTAMNVRGYTSALDAGVVKVAARRTGRLTVNRREVHFGPTTRAGRSLTRQVVLRDTGAASTVAVVAHIAVTGASFHLAKTSARTTHVRLTGGDTTTVTIAFTPSSVGMKHGSLVISRSDGRQRSMTVKLFGRGVRAGH